MNEEYAVEIILGCITALTALITTMLNLMFSRRQKLAGEREKEERKKLDEIAVLGKGMRTLLRFHLSQIYKSSVSEGFISIEDLSSAQDIYKSYHELGGNSTATMLFEKLSSMPNVKAGESKGYKERERKNENYGLYN